MELRIERYEVVKNEWVNGERPKKLTKEVFKSSFNCFVDGRKKSYRGAKKGDRFLDSYGKSADGKEYVSYATVL